mgnify:FL=1
MNGQRRYLRLSRVLVLSSTLLLLAAACGEDKEARSTADDIEADLGQGGDAGNPEQVGIGDLLAAAGNIEVDIRYRLTTKARDAEPVVDELTFAQDPPKKAVRTEDITIIIPGDGGVIFCGEDDKCLQVPALGDLASGLISSVLGTFLAGTNLGPDVEQEPDFERTDDRKIAGLNAICFSYRPTGGAPDGPKVSQCVDSKTGITLSVETSDGTSTSEVIAEKVGKPDVEDFNPPSEPT